MQEENTVLESAITGREVVVERPPTIPRGRTVSTLGAESVRASALTDKQRQALDAIRTSLKTRNMAPTRLELAKMMNLQNPSGVDGHLNALSKKGWIELLPSVDRGIRLLREGLPIVDADHLPSVAAGTPSVVEECQNLPRLNDIESIIDQFQSRPDFCVRVEGDSLDRLGFTTGDIVAVRHQPEARDGDVVLARIGEEVTLKRYQRTGPHTVEFQPESTNPDHQPIRADLRSDDVAIVGIVVGAIIGTRRSSE